MTIDLLIAVLSTVTAVIPAIIALFKLNQIHVMINSRMSELLDATYAQGVAKGELKPKDPLCTTNAVK